MISIPPYKIKIVRHKNDCHVAGFLQVAQNPVKKLETCMIDAGNRLVQQQKIRLGQRRRGKQYPL